MSAQSKTRGGLYLDALGEPGRGRGQPVYAQALAWVGQSDQEVEDIFRQVREALGLRASYEFHARQVTKEEWRTRLPQRFFALLEDSGLQTEVWLAGVHKTRTSLPLEFEGKRLVNELVSRTLKQMPVEHVRGLPLTIDERVHDKKAAKAVREMKEYVNDALQEQGYSIGAIRARESHRCAGIQLADFLVTAVMKPWPDCQRELAGWRIHEHWW